MPECEYYPNRKKSSCLRPVRARLMTLTRGALWLCAPHLKSQDEDDREVREKVLRGAPPCWYCGGAGVVDASYIDEHGEPVSDGESCPECSGRPAVDGSPCEA